MKAASSHLKNFVKLAFGGAVVYYVLHSKMVDFEALGELMTQPTNIMLGFACSAVSVLLCSVRWFLLAQAQGLTRSYRNIFGLTMIGNFFNLFMPGAVGGDVIKAWYIAGEEPTQKTRAIFTVLLDRVIGLSVFFFYSAAALLFFLDSVGTRTEIRFTAYAVWGFSVASMGAAALFFSPAVWEQRAFLTLIERLRGYKFLAKLIDAAMMYRNNPGAIVKAILLSTISIGITTLLYKWMGDALGIPLGLAQYFFIVPVALTASAVPLLPGGIGVGQVAFFTLFQWAQVADPGRGGSLATAVQIYTILFNCLGVVFYMKYRRRPLPQVGSADELFQSHRTVP